MFKVPLGCPGYPGCNGLEANSELSELGLGWGREGGALHDGVEVEEGNRELSWTDNWCRPQSLGTPSCNDQPWLNSHDDS